MVIDTSVLLAILEGEPEADAFSRLIESADTRIMSAVTMLETGIVVEARKGAAGRRALDLLIQTAGIDIVAFDGEQAALARQGFATFGKGRHPAGLNFGDCAVYGLAKASAEPILFKGEDFSKADAPIVNLS
ncbi:MAG: type II toxin-antitoxin system VapC family toxin [Planctomycetes bacterium]|nr:type II toxin-antitoxin system VapC family toxin [Planctomycetota bacterium]